MTRAKKKFVKKCRGCPDKKFSSNDEYLLHLEDEHDGRNTYFFMCSKCGKRYKTKNELFRHNKSQCGTMKIYSCQVCNKQLKSPGSLHNHMLKHTSQPTFMCKYCAKLFLTSGQLNVHERVHTKEKVFVCNVCNKSFCHRQSLITHNTVHTGIKPYQCETCGNSYSCIGNLLKHRKSRMDSCGSVPSKAHTVKNPSTKIKIQINTPEGSKVRMIQKTALYRKKIEEIRKASQPITEVEFRIPTSDFELNNTEGEFDQSLGNDANSSAETSDDEYPTNKESQLNNTNDEMIVENESIANEKQVSNNIAHSDDDLPNEENIEPGNLNKMIKKRASIELYKSKTILESDYSVFLKERYTETLDVISCKYCSKTYTHFRWLFKHEQQHIKSKLSSNIDIYKSVTMCKCECCNRKFKSPEERDCHKKEEHHKELTCLQCNKLFSNHHALRVHNNIHKGIPRKTYSYICDKCGMSFTSKATFTTHKINKCQKTMLFKCGICSKIFTRKYTLQSHMRIHACEKKYSCKFCNKTFHWSSQRTVHQRIHTNEKPFKCSYCPKTFTHRESLTTHHTVHTRLKPFLCEACGKGFSCLGNLIKHKTAHANTCGLWYKQYKGTGNRTK